MHLFYKGQTYGGLINSKLLIFGGTTKQQPRKEKQLIFILLYYKNMTTRQINNLLKNKQIDLYVRGNFGREYKTKLKKIEIDNRGGNYFIYCIYD